MNKYITESRALRALCTIGVVVATVATSQPQWSVSDSLETREVVLGPGEAATRRIRVQTNVPPETKNVFGLEVKVGLQDLVSTEGRIHYTDSCGRDQTFRQHGDTWCRDSELRDCLSWPDIVACNEPGDNELTIVNESAYPLSFGWKLDAVVSGEGDDEPPKDAWVTIEELP